MSARPRIDDAQRRARLQRRHLLTDDVPQAFSVTDAVSSIVGLHATCPPTMYLSLWARLPGFVREQLDSALYDERSLVKQLAMRRTMFVLDRAGLADAVGAVGPRVAASERTNMLRDLRRSNDFDDPEGWIDTARAAVVDALADGSVASSTELRKRLPELDGHVQIAPDRSWGGTAPMGPRVLNMMSAAGDIVRGPNAAGWHLSRPQWSSMQRWLGEPLPQLSVAEGHRAMVARWLRTFGPGTETDIVWWLGSTKASVRAALADLAAVEVDLDGEVSGTYSPTISTMSNPWRRADSCSPNSTRRRWGGRTVAGISATTASTCSTATATGDRRSGGTAASSADGSTDPTAASDCTRWRSFRAPRRPSCRPAPTSSPPGSATHVRNRGTRRRS